MRSEEKTSSYAQMLYWQKREKFDVFTSLLKSVADP